MLISNPAMFETFYGNLARRRRQWYAGRPGARRRLARPVVSIGNLSVGGSGKTPLVATLARWLIADGEKPAILSRGYARQSREEGVVVVCDAQRILADLARAGDEPLMLARTLEDVVVLVSSDRYLAGHMAEVCFGCTVHLLDDGFQHVALERDLSLLLVDPEDVDNPRLLPTGRLREPLSAASAADAVVVATQSADEVRRVADRLGVPRMFGLRRQLGAPKLVEPFGQPFAGAPGARVVAVAGVARPARFFDDLRRTGWTVATELTFRDHHNFTRRDVDNIVRAAHAAQAAAVMTTEKDVMRLLPLRPIPVPVVWLPLAVTIDPETGFRTWLRERIAAARHRDSVSGIPH